MVDPDQSAPAPDGSPVRRLFVKCGSKVVAVPFERVNEILVPQPFTRVPGSGPEVCGLIGLRGRVLTVFDLGAILGGPAIDRAADFRILVVRAADRVVGLAVAEVVTSIDDDQVPERSPGARPHGRYPMEPDLDRLIGARLS